MERIGTIENGGALKIDASRLIDTRALIQGSSGSGKSWLIRLLVEKVAAKIPVLILDLEGEFVTLREKFDFVVAGEGGEVDVNVRSASLLARKLLELKLSGIVSLYELDRPQRRAYVRYFLESVMAAPRELWSPRLIVIDEAHEFAPEGGQSDSCGAVIDIASRGRKRGYCLVAATQRLSKLHKDVAAECRNVFVGQTTLDVDVRRALDTLGFPADLEHKSGLRSLDHQFYAMGPATSANGVVLFQADAVKTTHPESGSRRSLSPPSPSQRIKQALGELADLPKQAEEEAKSMADAKRQIADLKRQLTAKPVPAADDKMVERAVAQAVAERDRFWKPQVTEAVKAHGSLANRLGKINQLSTLNGDASIAVSVPPIAKAADIPVHNRHPVLTNANVSRAAPPVAASRNRNVTGEESGGDRPLSKSERAILRAFYWLKGKEATPSKVSFYSEYSSGSSTWNNSLGRLRHSHVKGWAITPEGVAEVESWGNVEPKPTGQELREWLRRKLGKAENAMLDSLCSHHPNRMSNEQLSADCGYSTGSSTWNNSIGRLRTLEAAEGYERDGGVKAADVFFE